MLPTMVPPTSRPSGPSTGSTMDQRSNGVHGNSGVGLPFGSGIRKLTAAGNFPRPRGRPRGSFSSVRRLSTAREYLEFTRAYHQLRNQMKFANRMRLPADYKVRIWSVNNPVQVQKQTKISGVHKPSKKMSKFARFSQVIKNYYLIIIQLLGIFGWLIR